MTLLQTISRGGHTHIHHWRLFKQVFIMAALLSFLVGLSWGSYQLYRQTPRLAWLQSFEYLVAKVNIKIWSRISAPEETPYLSQTYIPEQGHAYRRSSFSILQDTRIKGWYRALYYKARAIFYQSIFLSSLCFVLIFLFWWGFGRYSQQEKHTKGVSLVDPPALRRLLRRQKQASDLCLDTLPLVKGKETSHMLITGTTGAGKSNCFYTLLPQIRARGDRAIVVDVTGDYVARFYDPARDLLLNPFDARSVCWDPWEECRHDTHYDTLAAALIPSYSSQDTFWDEAARQLLSAAFKELKARQEAHLPRLLEVLSCLPLPAFQEFFHATSVASLADKEGERTTVSIRSNLVAHLKGLEHCRPPQEGEPPFAVRSWLIEQEKDKAKHSSRPSPFPSWLFITARADQRATLTPLMATWLECAINTLLCLPPDPLRRVWLIMDELPALSKIPSLETGLAELRKHGGCILAGIQSISQLSTLYGTQKAQAMLDLFNTKIFFRCSDPTTLQWISKVLGEQEVKEVVEHISYGANALRDGVSLAPQAKLKPLVLPTEIASLNDLEGYIKLPGNFPVAKMKLLYKKRPPLLPSFVEREE